MKKNNFKIVELKPISDKSSIKRTVFIKDFIIEEIIGIHKHEKIKKQKIKFNIVLDVNQNSVPDEKDIKSIVDYEKITNKLENLAKSKKYNFFVVYNTFNVIFNWKSILININNYIKFYFLFFYFFMFMNTYYFLNNQIFNKYSSFN